MTGYISPLIHNFESLQLTLTNYSGLDVTPRIMISGQLSEEEGNALVKQCLQNFDKISDLHYFFPTQIAKIEIHAHSCDWSCVAHVVLHNVKLKNADMKILLENVSLIDLEGETILEDPVDTITLQSKAHLRFHTLVVNQSQVCYTETQKRLISYCSSVRNLYVINTNQSNFFLPTQISKVDYIKLVRCETNNLKDLVERFPRAHFEFGEQTKYELNFHDKKKMHVCHLSKASSVIFKTTQPLVCDVLCLSSKLSNLTFMHPIHASRVIVRQDAEDAKQFFSHHLRFVHHIQALRVEAEENLTSFGVYMLPYSVPPQLELALPCIFFAPEFNSSCVVNFVDSHACFVTLEQNKSFITTNSPNQIVLLTNKQELLVAHAKTKNLVFPKKMKKNMQDFFLNVLNSNM